MYRASGLVPSYGIATGASDTATSAGRRRQTVLTCSLALPFIKSVVRIKQPANSATGRAACQHGKVSHRSLERGSRPDTAGSRETVGILQLPMPSAPFPGLCQQILARRQAARQEKIAEVKRTLQDLLLKVPAVSLRIASQRTGFSCAYLKELCREECAALGSWYVRWRNEASERRKMGLFQDIRNAVRQLHDEGNG